MTRQKALFARLLAVAAMTLAAVPALAQPAVSASFADGRWLTPRETIELRFPESPSPLSGRTAVIIGHTDWTDLFETVGTVMRYRPAALALPSGASSVAVYRIDQDDNWSEIARFTLQVLNAAGFESATLGPSASFNLSGQAAVDPPPTDNSRRRYQDLTYTLGWLSTLVRSGWTTTAQMNTLGAGRAGQALRFNELGENAPLYDLSDYLVSFEHGRSRVALGHVSWDAQRHLVNQFATRGIAATIQFGPAVDVSWHAMNGSSLVGWGNPTGLSRSVHQIIGADVGVELVPARPGAARFSATFVDASVLPLSGFTEALVNDAEKSRGIGLRFKGTDVASRLAIDGGFSRSRFRNPDDPLLAQGAPLVSTRATSQNARYLDLSYAILPPGTGTLSAAFRHSRVDPLYRSIAASSQADLMENVVAITGGVREATSEFAWTMSHDDLDDLPSMMRTSTRVAAWRSAVPLSAFTTGAPASLPVVSFSLNQMRQFGDGLPANSLFDSVSQVPDQLTTSHTLGAEWQASHGRVVYQWNRSLQDNRQSGRATSDFRTMMHTIGAGLAPTTAFEVEAEVGFEGIDALEQGTHDSTRRVGVNGTWRPGRFTSVGASLSRTFSGNDPRTRHGRSSDFTFQLTQDVVFAPRNPNRLRGQGFVRFARRTNRLTDLEFGANSRDQSWVLNTGLTFRIF